MDGDSGQSDWPFVSLVLVVRNEEPNIAECLASLANQQYPRDRMEIVLVDGLSTDRTREIAGSFPTEGISLRILSNPQLGRAHGLNLAIRASRGDIIARVDARTRMASDYVVRCVRAMAQAGADNVGGVQQAVGKTPMQAAIALALSHPFGVGGAPFRVGKRSGYVDSVYPGFFRREVFDRVGLFDDQAPVISEDSDLNYRIRRAGGRVYMDTDIVVQYESRESLRDLWRLYFRYGGARAGTVLKHGRVWALRQLVPPLFALTVAGLAVLSLWRRMFVAPLAAAGGLYVLATVLLAATLALRRRDLVLGARLLAVFPTMHLAWALGFWRRLTQRSKPGTYWGY